ncbi:MAG: thioredoxin domain-containing protein, partial [Bacteroidetes bacterium]
RTGENVLHQRCTFEEAAGAYGTTAEALRRRWEAARQKLLAHRSRRPRPLRDDKVLTDWNGLMIAALAQAARILNTPAYADAARRATRFLLDTLRTPEGRLLHRWQAGQAGIPAMADDYASLIWGLIELYETTYDPAFLATALDLNRDFLDHFWDEAEGGFFLTADDAEPLLVRQKPLFDGALPSANAIAMLNLLRLARMTGRTDLEARAARVGELMGPYVRQMPSAFTGFLLALGFAAGPSYEVVVAGSPDAEDTRALLGALRQAYVPNMVVVLRPPGDGADITRLAPFTAAHTPVDGRAAAYVCHHFACRRPTTDPEEMLAALQG